MITSVISKNNFTPLTVKQFRKINTTAQENLSNCYMVSSLKALSKTKFGIQWLADAVSESKNVFRVVFKGITGQNSFFVKESKNYHKITRRKDFNALGAIEAAASSAIRKKPSLKPLVCRLGNPFASRIENNKASNFMYMLTGKKPVNLGDDGILPLTFRSKKAKALLKKISETNKKDFAFVASSKIEGSEDLVHTQHYYIIDKVDMKNNKIKLRNPRFGCLENPKDGNLAAAQQEYLPVTLTIDQFLKNFRSIVGYFG